MREDALALAAEYDLELSKLDEALFGADLVRRVAVLARRQRRSIREREREARRSLRADPADNDAWCELHSIQAGRAPVVFNSNTRELTVEESTANRNSRRRTDDALNFAVQKLAGVWERKHGPVKRYSGSDATEGISVGLCFLITALEAAGFAGSELEPPALRKRLARLS